MIDNIIGNKVLVRIVRFLFLSPNRYFSFLDIEKYLGVGRESIHLALRKLDYYSMVYVEKKGGKRYKLRLDNPLVKHMEGLLEYEKRFLQGIDPKKLHVISNIENDCIKNIPGLKDIWLFGSVAKGKSTEKSDIDLFIVVQINSAHIKTTVEEIKEKYEEKFKIQTLIMGEDEFFKRRKEKLVKEILESGINLKLL
jgi:predicted nucleotidyltransferase